MSRPRRDFAAELAQLSRDVSAEASAWFPSQGPGLATAGERELLDAVAKVGSRRHGNAVLYGHVVA